jgi:hypothetical protein
MRPYLKKKPSQEKGAGGVAQGIGPEFKLQYQKKKKSHKIMIQSTTTKNDFDSCF